MLSSGHSHYCLSSPDNKTVVACLAKAGKLIEFAAWGINIGLGGMGLGWEKCLINEAFASSC